MASDKQTDVLDVVMRAGHTACQTIIINGPSPKVQVKKKKEEKKTKKKGRPGPPRVGEKSVQFSFHQPPPPVQAQEFWPASPHTITDKT